MRCKRYKNFIFTIPEAQINKKLDKFSWSHPFARGICDNSKVQLVNTNHNIVHTMPIFHSDLVLYKHYVILDVFVRCSCRVRGWLCYIAHCMWCAMVSSMYMLTSGCWPYTRSWCCFKASKELIIPLFSLVEECRMTSRLLD